MNKKWKPVPERIEEALRSAVNSRYAELIATLPDADFNPNANPSLSIESKGNGYCAEVCFYGPNKQSRLSIWEYTIQNLRWYMVRDWMD